MMFLLKFIERSSMNVAKRGSSARTDGSRVLKKLLRCLRKKLEEQPKRNKEKRFSYHVHNHPFSMVSFHGISESPALRNINQNQKSTKRIKTLVRLLELTVIHFDTGTNRK